MPAYAGTPDSVIVATAWCVAATVGDGVLTIIAHLIAVSLYRDRR